VPAATRPRLPVRRRQGGQRGAAPVQRDQRPGLARREPEALLRVSRCGREAEQAVQAAREQEMQQAAHLEVYPLQGAEGGPHTLVEREGVEILGPARERLDVVG